MIKARHLLDMRQKQRCGIAGVVLVRQRPGTAKGVVFMTADLDTLSEDELPEVVAHANYMKSPVQSRRPPERRRGANRWCRDAAVIQGMCG